MHTLALPCPTLIGRTADLAALHLLLDQAGKGQGGVALISGDAGIGKSRLIAEAKAYAASHNVLPVQGNCFPADVASPYAPLLDLLRFLFDQYPWTRSFTLTPQVAQAFQPWFSHLAPENTAPPLSSSPARSQAPAEKRQLFEVLTHFLAALSAQQPLLLVVEDLHWSDETSLELLHYLARRSRTCALLLVLSYRSDAVNAGLRDFLAQMDRERLAQELHLSPLLPAEVEAMVQTCLSLPRTGLPELFYAIYPLSEGNPFFLEELLKALVTAGELFVEDDRWLCKPLGTMHVPRSVRATVEPRVALLSDQAREVVTLAAVAGRRFDFALLLHLTRAQEAELLQALKGLIAAQLVVEESVEQFAFRHALTRQAIYAQLLARERQALHHLIAEAMEQLYASTLEAHLVDLAHHFYEAGAWTKALDYGWQAGEKALRLYAPQAAMEQLTRALEAAHKGALTPHAIVYHLRGQANETLGDFERARLDYETALLRARETDERRVAWQTLIDLGLLWAERDYVQSGTYYQQALALALQLDDPLVLAYSLNRLGNWHVNVEQPLEALQCHQQALAIFQEAGDVHGLAETYDLLGLACNLRGDLSQGALYLEQAAAGFWQVDDRRGLASCLANQVIAGGIYESDTVVAVPLMRSAEALARGEEALKLAREMDQRSAEAYALCTLGHCLGAHGEYTRAIALAREGFQIAESIEHRQWMTYGHWVLGKLYLDMLAATSAQQHLERALALAQEIGSFYWLRITTGLLARVYTLQHDFSRAEAVLHAAGTLDAPPQTYGQLMIWGAHVDLARAGGHFDQALRLVEQLIATARSVSPERMPSSLLLMHGEVLLQVQREAEAESVLQNALAGAEMQDVRPLLWRIHLALGKLFLAQHRQEDAQQALVTVQEITQELAARLPEEGPRERFLTTVATRLPRSRPLTPAPCCENELWRADRT